MTSVFTDGAASRNGHIDAIGGVGVWFGDDHPGNLSKRFEGDKENKVTNQIMELRAVMLALERFIELQLPLPLVIISDSDYTIKCATVWCKGWVKNGWLTSKKLPVLNKDIIARIVELVKQTGASFTHVSSHRKEPPINDGSHVFWYGNHEADRLATDATKNTL